MTQNLVLAVTGASGAIYAVRLLEVLLGAGRDVHLVMSRAGAEVFRHELGLEVDLDDFRPESLQLGEGPAARSSSLHRLWVESLAAREGQQESPSPGQRGRLEYHRNDDFMSPIASGSHLTSGMVVCPCSGGTMSAIAHAASTNLIHRAADVHLKEGRKLVLVPRETPLSAIQLENMRRVVEAGAVVLPAMPGFYHGVRSIVDLVDFVVARICDQLGVEQNLIQRWGK